MSEQVKTFLRGMGQALDLGGTLTQRRTLTGPEADAQALRGDWEKVGGDIRKAMGRFEGQTPETPERVINAQR